MLSKSTLSCLLLFAASACQSVHQGDCLDCTYVHEYGVPIESEQWVRNGCNGQKIISSRDGVSVSQTYVDGRLHGPSIYSYPFSDITERIEEYSNNNLKKQIFFNENGLPVQSVEYLSPNVRQVTMWYSSGSPLSIEIHEGPLLKSGKYYTLSHQQDSWVYNGDGERIIRNDLGDLVSRDTFKNGQLVSATHYHLDGSPREIINYKKGQIHGERKYYYPGGEPLRFETWENGEQTGITTVFQDGERFSEIYFIEGRKNGLERRYRDGTFIIQEISWKDDKMHGPMYTYLDDSTVQTDWYYKGRLTTKSNFDSFAIPKALKK